MATNNLAPIGFSFTRNYISGANTYAQTAATILNGYTSAIGMGDPVILNANGTVNIASAATGYTATSYVLGFFAGVLPYYDTTLQAISHGLNGSYVTTAAPVAGTNIPCLVVTDPFATFLAQIQYSGAGFQQSWYGMNATWIQSSVGTPNASGRSVAVVDGVTNVPATTLGFPLRIVGPAGVSGGPQDPANANPWIEVRLNNSAALGTTGV